MTDGTTWIARTYGRRVDNPYSLTLAEVRALAAQGNLIPLYREIVADLETPVSAYLKVARGPYSFLLESIEGGERMARYSFIGTDPHTVLRFSDGALQRWERSGTTSSAPCADPLAALRAELAGLRQVPQPGLPPLVGGAVGYLAYEVVRCYERLPIKDTAALGVPDAIFMLTDTVLAFDHLRHSIKVMTHVRLDNPAVDCGAGLRTTPPCALRNWSAGSTAHSPPCPPPARRRAMCHSAT